MCTVKAAAHQSRKRSGAGRCRCDRQGVAWQGVKNSTAALALSPPCSTAARWLMTETVPLLAHPAAAVTLHPLQLHELPS